ncbi:MAG: phosphoribosyltransferase family protein [Flavobacteriaceae bacterium]|nr:phosphoribosyltransferase family protein [Flavobacteriaceae bacterium]
MKKTQKILEQDQIDKIVKRIAYQILENNSEELEIFLIGIKNNGYILAELIYHQLKHISNLNITLYSIQINKKDPLKGIEHNFDLKKMKNKSIVLIDDVLNSGRTLLYGVKFLLDIPLSNFNTAVLIDRNHKKYPIKIDFKGISLSTSIEENVSVIFEKNNAFAIIN